MGGIVSGIFGGVSKLFGGVFGGVQQQTPALPAPPPVPDAASAQAAADAARKRYANAGGRASTVFAGETSGLGGQPQTASRILLGQ